MAQVGQTQSLGARVYGYLAVWFCADNLSYLLQYSIRWYCANWKRIDCLDFDFRTFSVQLGVCKMELNQYNFKNFFKVIFCSHHTKTDWFLNELEPINFHIISPKNIAFINNLFVPYQKALKFVLSVKAITRPFPKP